MRFSTAVATLLAISSTLPASDAFAPLAAQAKLDGGLVVQIGAPDADLLGEAAASGSWVALAVTRDRALAEAARTQLAGKTLLGMASVADWIGTTLPVQDRAAALVLAEAGVDVKEAMRILRPLGVLMQRDGAGWKQTVKPWDDRLDGWTHHHGRADHNDSNNDQVVSKASGLQWTAGGMWAEDCGVRAIGHRIIVASSRSQGDGRKVPGTLVCRDAFSGVPLWERDLDPGGRLALLMDAERVYVHPSIGGPLLGLDIATGKTVHTYDQGFSLTATGKDGYSVQLPTVHEPRVIVSDGVMVQAFRNEIIALDPATGKRLWAHKAADGQSIHFCAAATDVVVHSEGAGRISANTYAGFARTEFTRLVARNLKTGAERWVYAYEDPKAQIANLVIAQGRVGVALLDNTTSKTDVKGKLLNLDLATGAKKFLIDANTQAGYSGHGYFRTTIQGDAQYAVKFAKIVAGAKLSDGSFFQRDEFSRDFRCQPARFTPNVLVSSLCTASLSDDRFYWTEAARSKCDIGVFPINGLLVQTATNCGCFAWMSGNNAFHGGESPKAPAQLDRLIAGTAKPAPTPGGAWPAPADWPMHLAAPSHSMWNDAAPPLKPTIAWTAKLGAAESSAPVGKDQVMRVARVGAASGVAAAEGAVVLSLVDRNEIVALNPADGAVRWRAAVDGRVDTAPTIYQGIVLCGTQSGWVYALNRDNGQLIWRFFAAPETRRIIADGQAASPWSVHGAVQIMDGLAWVAAGREITTDGGFFWWGLDPATGTVKKQGRTGFDSDWLKESDYLKGNSRSPLQKNPGGRFGNASTPPLAYKGVLRMSQFGYDTAKNAMVSDHSHWMALEHDGWNPDRAFSVPGQNRTANSGLIQRGPIGTASVYLGVMSVWHAIRGQEFISLGCNVPYSGGRPTGTGNKLVRWKAISSKKPLSDAGVAYFNTKPSASTINCDFVWGAATEKYMQKGKDNTEQALAVGRTAVITAIDRTVVIFDINSGADSASIQMPARVSFAGLAIAGDRIYVSCDDGSVVCLR